MRSWVKAAGCICLVLGLVGCAGKGSTPPSGAPVPVSEPVPTPVAAPSVAASGPSTASPLTDPPLPAVALWAPPGQQMVTFQGFPLSISYAPLKLGGYTAQPLWAGEGILYLRQDGLDVYLHGTSARGGLALVTPPRLLYRLPLKAGSTWEISWPGMIGQTNRNTVEGVEKVPTPVGEQLAARISVTSKLSRKRSMARGCGTGRIGSS